MESSRCGRWCRRVLVWIVYTAMCLGIPVMLFFFDSDIHRWVVEEKKRVWGVAYFTLLALSFVSYFMASLINPGYLPKNKDKDDNDDADDDADDDNSEEDSKMLSKFKEKLFFCESCNRKQPLRTRHCKDCGRCVRKYDHHCPWLANCIGEKNHKVFWFFILFNTLLMAWTIVITFRSMTSEPHWGEWLLANGALVAVLVLLGLLTLMTVSLLVYHTFLAVVGSTTWELGSRKRITYLMDLEEGFNPFNQGPCCNTYKFCCTCSVQHWEKVYKSKPEVT